MEIINIQNPEEMQRQGVHPGFLSKPTRYLFFTGNGGVRIASTPLSNS